MQPDPTQYQNADIVEHCRDLAAMCGEKQYHDALHTAADDIVRLREAHDKQVEAAWRLQDIVTRISECIRPRCEGEPWDLHASHVLDEIEKVLQDA